ncbi:hypothetical protein FRC12_001568 [Ceratobasidium sp. 428]|nr:hypothetical protein FRC12_001568 [Ceratobasidium sp. 428]
MAIVGDTVSFKHLHCIPLDESAYSLAPDELEFYQSTTNIDNEVELKRHILDIQAKAYKIFPYPCIRGFMFTKLKVLRYPAYAHVLEYGRTHPDAIFLEMACCFGNDARKAALDGYPVKNIVATDLRRDFWDLGFKLFKDDPVTFPVPFLQGDIFDTKFLDPDATKSSNQPDFSGLNSLTDLLGHTAIIHASAFFHLFSEEDQRKIAERCVALLDHVPGATIFGSHVGGPEPGIYDNSGGANRKMFCHSPQSWEKLWKELFGETPINVVATLEDKDKEANSPIMCHGPLAGDRRSMVWNITVI